jgi:NAD(P)-dependent dehydrogenase (short-subunit alcohol dehydrogenase family)
VTATSEGPVAVVTGGAVGIGAAIAEELGRQGAYVVTVDPGVAVDGRPQSGDDGAPSTAQRIVDAGGRARASSISVTDADAVHALFAQLVDEFGTLDAVVNVAGISRATGFAHGAEDDWRAVLSVHVDGYLTVLRAALPIMTAAGRGRILGVTSGSGWRAADAGAYSCAKRAVAALTWQIGRVVPHGVTVNALSPLAATRMVLGALSRQAGAGNRGGRDAATGGVDLATSVPPPEHLGPVGAYLAGDDFASWSSGQIVYSNGAEVSPVGPPRVLEVVPASGFKSLSRALEVLTPAALAPAEAAQVSNGGGNPRLAALLDDSAADEADAPAAGRRCVIVADRAAWGDALADALGAAGFECTGIGAWHGAATGPTEVADTFDGAIGQLAGVARDAGGIDAVVVAITGDGSASAPADAPEWQRVLAEHDGITDRIRVDAAWVRAVSELATADERAVRVVTVVGAASSGGKSRAQSATQLSRSAHSATADLVDAFAISVETADPSARGTVADAAAFLASSTGASALSGAELVVEGDWLGLRSHPHPLGTVTYGGPDVPAWLDGALREMADRGARSRTEEV